MNDFSKTVRVGSGRNGSIFCEIEYKGGRLSISGVEGPKADGDCTGNCGQIVMNKWGINNYAPGWDAAKVARFREVWNKWHLNDLRAGCEHQVGPEWTHKEVKLYHFELDAAAYAAKKETERLALEALKAGESFVPSKEQTMAAKLPLSMTSHIEAPPKYYTAEKQTKYSSPVETKSTNWLRQDEHPEGFLGKPCPVCGYKYGTAWKKEDVPDDVLEFLKGLPDTDVKPAWV